LLADSELLFDILKYNDNLKASFKNEINSESAYNFYDFDKSGFELN